MKNSSAPAPAAVKSRPTETVRLSSPIIRGETQIDTLTLRKPKAGQLRGLSIQELMTARVSSALDLLPRITMPPITQEEADDLEPEDVGACAGAIIGFFLTAEDQSRIEEISKR